MWNGNTWLLHDYSQANTYYFMAKVEATVSDISDW